MSSHSSIRRHLLVSVAGLSIASLAGPALAQSAAPAEAAPAAADQAADGALEEIVVTAERRTQSLQDVPISATVLNAADLSRKGVNNLADIQQVAPSIAINTFNRSTFINIRGVGIAQSAPTSNPGVAFYIDGQLIPHEQFIGQSFYDIGSIEVLRGPQGTLTGQNSTGGAIYVRTPNPEYDAISGYIDQTAGNYDAFKTVAALNVPFSDNVAIRVAGTRDVRDSFTKNIGPSPSDPGNVHLYAGRFNLAARSNDEVVRVNLRFDYFDSKSDNNAVKRRGDTVSTNPFVIEEDARGFQNQDGYRLSGESKIAVTPGIDFRALFSYQDLKTIDQTDGDRTATALPRPPATAVGRVSLVSTKFDTAIGEINLLSTGKGPFNWVVGAFYLDEFVDTFSQRDNNHTTDFVSSTSTFKTRAHNVSKSVFGQANWFVTEPLELIAGVRYSSDKQVYNRLIPAGVVPAGASLIATQKSNKVTGKVGINYHLDQTLLYVTASQGYKAGGVNLTINTPNFGPETNRVYEAGVKTTLLDRHLRVNGDVFYSDYKDIQFSSLLAGLPLTQNAASGHSYGGELEITGQFGGFSVNAGAGYLHARFADSTCITDTNSAGTDVGCPTNLRFVPKGRVLPFSPKWTINAGVQYAVPLGETMSLTPRVQWSHLSMQVATPFPSVNTIVPSRDVFDARLTLDINDKYKLEGYVSNFTDKTYIASQIQNSSSADGGSIYGAPRTYGVRAVAKF
jgi:iron complex outermembrane receptor protein